MGNPKNDNLQVGPILSSLSLIDWMDGNIHNMALRVLHDTMEKSHCDPRYWVRRVGAHGFQVVYDGKCVTTFTHNPDEVKAVEAKQDN